MKTPAIFCLALTWCLLPAITAPCAAHDLERAPLKIPASMEPGLTIPAELEGPGKAPEDRLRWQCSLGISTAYAYNVLAEDVASRLQLALSPALDDKHSPIMMAGAALKSCVVPYLRIGAQQLTNVPFLIASPQAMLGQLGKIDGAGVLGAGFLSRYAVCINADHTEMRLYPGGKLTDAELKSLGAGAAGAVNITPTSYDRWYVPITMNGTVKEWAMLDPLAWYFSIEQRSAMALGLEPAGTAKGAAGSQPPDPGGKGTVASLAIGSSTFKQISTGWSRVEGANQFATIGLSLLGRTAVIMDYPARKLYLIPAPSGGSAGGQAPAATRLAVNADLAASPRQPPVVSVGLINTAHASEPDVEIGRLAIATEARNNVLTTEMARRLHLTLKPSTYDNGMPVMVSGIQVYQTVVPTMTVGNGNSDNIAFIVLPAAVVRQEFRGVPVDGALADSYLSWGAVMIDGPHGHLYMWPNGKLMPADLASLGFGHAQSIALKSDASGFRTIEVGMNALRDQVYLATGAATCLSQQQARQLGFKVTGSIQQLPTAEGPLSCFVSLLDRLVIGDQVINKLPVHWNPHTGGMLVPDIGMDVLYAHPMLIDYPAGKVYLTQ